MSARPHKTKGDVETIVFMVSGRLGACKLGWVHGWPYKTDFHDQLKTNLRIAEIGTKSAAA